MDADSGESLSSTDSSAYLRDIALQATQRWDSLTSESQKVAKKQGWVIAPGIKGVDRPWIRKRHGRWTITYSRKILVCGEGTELKSVHQLATFMAKIEAFMAKIED